METENNMDKYDTCFLDWVLFANLPMCRLEGTEHMDRAYCGQTGS